MTSLSSLNRRHLLASAVATSVAIPFGMARAQAAFPTKTITVINPFQPGGIPDAYIRTASELASKQLGGQSIIIDYKQGAGGAVGAQYVMAAPPDGHTLLMYTSAMNRQPYVMDVNYNPTRDFTYIIGMAEVSFLFVARASAPWKTMPEIIAAAKAEPGKISYSSPGLGTAPHLKVEEMALAYGVKFNHIPYRGNDYVRAVGAGEVDFAMDTMASAPLVDAGRARVIAVLGNERFKRWPDVPTLREQGVNLVVDTRMGVIGPKGMNPKTVETIHNAYRAGMQDPAFEAMLEKATLKRWYAGPAQFESWVKEAFTQEGEALNKLGMATRKPT